jgi:hypothetical protein
MREAFPDLTKLQRDRVYRVKLEESRTSFDSLEERNSPLNAQEQAVLEKFISVMDEQV